MNNLVAPYGETEPVSIFSGYASLFNVEDHTNEIILHGAFRKSLKDRDCKKVPMLWQHDPTQPLGTWIDISEQQKGLHVTGQFCLESTQGRNAAALVSSGAIGGLSIGFKTVRAGRVGQTKRRHIYEVDLWEISIVTFPALEQARILHLNTASSFLNERLQSAAQTFIYS